MARTLFYHLDAHDEKRGVFAGLDHYDRTHTGTRLVLHNPFRVQVSDAQAAKIERCFVDRTPFDIRPLSNGGVRVVTY